jgi:hypothetical protein
MGVPIDISDQRFGRLVAVDSRTTMMYGRSRILWRCRCDCGGESENSVDQLRSGVVQSCGCLKRERISAANRTHGGSQTRTYNIWHGMLNRCYETYSTMYYAYGAVGMRVCEGWRNSFVRFREDMGEPPGPGYSIDRIENGRGYTCGKCPECLANGWVKNCRWADRVAQNNNTKRNHVIEYNGESLTLSQWARKVGIRPGLLQARLVRLGWSIEKALTTPPNPVRQQAALVNSRSKNKLR